MYARHKSNTSVLGWSCLIEVRLISWLQFHNVLAADESSLLPKKWVHRWLAQTDRFQRVPLFIFSWCAYCKRPSVLPFTGLQMVAGGRGLIQRVRPWVPQNVLLPLSLKGFYNSTTVLRDIFRNKPTIQNIPKMKISYKGLLNRRA